MKTQRTRNLWLVGIMLVGLLAPGVAAAVEVGDRAPDFTLPSTTGEDVSLSQFQGKKLVLVEFHINDFGAT
jgi:AhpC/TSA family